MLVLLCCLPILVLAIDYKCTVNVSWGKNRHTSIKVDNVANLTGSGLRQELKSRMRLDDIILCHPKTESLGEIEDNKILGEQGLIEKITFLEFEQSYVVLEDTFSGIEQQVKACAGSTLRQVLARADKSVYPEDTTFIPVGRNVDDKLGVDDINSPTKETYSSTKIKVKPVLGGANSGKWMIWMLADPLGHVKIDPIRFVNSWGWDQVASVYKLIDNTTKQVGSTITDAVVKNPNNTTIFGRIPVSGPIKKPTDGNNMVKVGNLKYGLISVPSNPKPYLVALGEHEMKNVEKVVKSILEEFGVVKNFSEKWKFQNPPTPELFSDKIKMRQELVIVEEQAKSSIQTNQESDTSEHDYNSKQPNLGSAESNANVVTRSHQKQGSKLEFSLFKWVKVGIVVVVFLVVVFLVYTCFA